MTYPDPPSCKSSVINSSELQTHGWTSFVFQGCTDEDYKSELLSIANHLGVVVPSRTGNSICETLIPTAAHQAKVSSLSRIYSTGEFPLHIDTAHWVTPCRYVVLCCLSPGSATRPTLLLDVRRLPLDAQQTSLLQSTPIRITNGRNSFFSTILSKNRPFVRFDPGCMTPITLEGGYALSILTRENWPTYIEPIYWQAGMVVVIDNWRMLHGRAHAQCPDLDRKLLRILIR